MKHFILLVWITYIPDGSLIEESQEFTSEKSCLEAKRHIKDIYKGIKLWRFEATCYPKD